MLGWDNYTIYDNYKYILFILHAMTLHTCAPWELSASWHTNVTKSESVSCPFSGYLAGLCCSGPDVAEP